MRTKVVNTLAGTAALALLSLTPPPTAHAQAQPAINVRVSVSNIRSHQGFIMVALYDEANWGRIAAARARVPVTGNIVNLTLAAPAPGSYAIRMFHDVNADGAMDTNFIGLPTEPVGFSNNARIRFGPPSFSAVAFDVPASGATQSIALR